MGDALYIGSCAGRFYKLDRAHGALLGSHDVEADSVQREFHGDPAIWSDLLLIATDTAAGDSASLFAFQRHPFRVRWRLPMGRGATSDIVVSDGRAYAITLEDELICFDPSTGLLNWVFSSNTETDRWRTVSPLVLGGRVFFGDRDGTVHAVDAITGRKVWKRELQEVRTGIAAAGGMLYLVRGHGTVVALDPITGAERSRTTIPGGPYFGPIAVTTDSLLLLLGENAITCYDVASGSVRWTRSETRPWSSSRPYVWHGTVLAGSEGGLLFGYRLGDGAEQWVHSLTGAIRGIGVGGDTLYVGTLRGRVHALVRRK